MKVVEAGYKIDLHIHSACSSTKDRGKVSYNTLEHMDTLIEKLNENNVQICALTDHDTFNYEYYKRLKQAESGDNSILKVFPGVEFSVEFTSDEGINVIHVIAIFNDENDDKLKKISDYLLKKDHSVNYDRDQAFSESRFLSILRDIDIDTVLIAHQKNTLSSSKPGKNDANRVGEKRFKEFIYTDYFEAFEFKNRRCEVFNKNFLNTNHLTEDIRFITGSDCHDWRVYPRVDSTENTEFKFTYVKCLPNFRGLVMAITDHRRIKTVNSFFNPDEVWCPSLELSIGDDKYSVELSKGINVIIGDNSIGKSMLIHKLTGYCKKQDGLLKSPIINGYNAYLKNNRINILTSIPDGDIFAFDMQGEIREKFEQNKLKSDMFLKKYYPEAINATASKKKVQQKVKSIFRYLEEKYSIETKEAQLGRFSIIDEASAQAESLTFVGSVRQNMSKVNGLNKVRGDLDSISTNLGVLLEDSWVESSDKETIKDIIKRIDKLSNKYSNKKDIVEKENTKISLFQAAIDSFKEKYNSSVSDSQKKLSSYNEHIMNAVNDISDLIIRKKKNTVPSLKIESEKITAESLRVHDYCFNSRLEITEITEDYIENLFATIMKNGVKQSVVEMTSEELTNSVAYIQGSPQVVLDQMKEKLDEKIEKDFKNKFTITQAGTDKTQELSAGFNSKIYFDILSYETSHSGIYIIDQPEDNVSQKAIREYLLDRFKRMSENRQMIIITHNPQFIVNLDVDNVIFLGKDKDKLYIQNGALEYKDDTYNVLDIVSSNIEGGLDTLKRRWKRYEKNTTV